jgi:hypothetical protein
MHAVLPPAVATAVASLTPLPTCLPAWPAAPALKQDAQYVRRGQAPGPATVGSSCIYVLRRPDGFFYAGSTEALYDRIRAHRQASPTL